MTIKELTQEQYDFLIKEKELLQTFVKSKYVNGIPADWLTQAKRIYTLITGEVPGTCSHCTARILSILYRGITLYERNNPQTFVAVTIRDTDDPNKKQVIELPEPETAEVSNIVVDLSKANVGNCDECEEEVRKNANEQIKGNGNKGKENGSITSTKKENEQNNSSKNNPRKPSKKSQ